MTSRRLPFLFIFILLLSTTHLQANNGLQIITSIRPLQLITNEILGTQGLAKLLIKSDQSPHHFQLKPSQLRLASKADLLIWISNDFETGLNRLQNILSPQTQQLELIRNLPKSNLIGEHRNIDGHIWLSPENVLIIAQLISQKLSLLDPDNDQIYLSNTLKLTQKISQWKRESQQSIRELKPRYILDHNFLAYFERSFGLNNLGTLRNNHDEGSSIKQLSYLYSQLQTTPAQCLLVTALPLSSQAQQISTKFGLNTPVINTLDTNNNYHSIIDLLDSIVKNISNCQ